HGPYSSADGDAQPADPETVLMSQLLDEEVENALRQLPIEFLETVLLVDIQELTYEEASRALGCPVGTIRSRLSRGRRLLADSLRRYARERGYLRRQNYALR